MRQSAELMPAPYVSLPGILGLALDAAGAHDGTGGNLAEGFALHLGLCTQGGDVTGRQAAIVVTAARRSMQRMVP